MGKNLIPPVPLRLDRELREWLINYSQEKEEAVNAVVKKALREYRAKVEQENRQQKGQ